MNPRSSRLQRIVSLAEAEERQCALNTRRARARLTEQLDRLAELNACRQKYAGAARRSSKLQSAHWKDRQNFLARLDLAVRSQRQIVSDCERRIALHRRQWQEKRQRVESLQRVVNRFRSDEQSHAERLEQRRLDDRPALPDFYEDES